MHALFKTERGNGGVSYAVAMLLLLQTCRLVGASRHTLYDGKVFRA